MVGEGAGIYGVCLTCWFAFPSCLAVSVWSDSEADKTHSSEVSSFCSSSKGSQEGVSDLCSRFQTEHLKTKRNLALLNIKFS